MSILYAIINLFQLIILVALTGVLVSIAAVSRLMEVTIILIYPASIFLLRQSGKLVVLLVNLSARLTSEASRKICEAEPATPGTSLKPLSPKEVIATLNLRSPEIPYVKTSNPYMEEDRTSEVFGLEEYLESIDMTSTPNLQPPLAQESIETDL